MLTITLRTVVADGVAIPVLAGILAPCRSRGTRAAVADRLKVYLGGDQARLQACEATPSPMQRVLYAALRSSFIVQNMGAWYSLTHLWDHRGRSIHAPTTGILGTLQTGTSPTLSSSSVFGMNGIRSPSVKKKLRGRRRWQASMPLDGILFSIKLRCGPAWSCLNAIDPIDGKHCRILVKGVWSDTAPTFMKVQGPHRLTCRIEQAVSTRDGETSIRSGRGWFGVETVEEANMAKRALSGDADAMCQHASYRTFRYVGKDNTFVEVSASIDFEASLALYKAAKKNGSRLGELGEALLLDFRDFELQQLKTGIIVQKVYYTPDSILDDLINVAAWGAEQATGLPKNVQDDWREYSRLEKQKKALTTTEARLRKFVNLGYERAGAIIRRELQHPMHS